MLEVWLKLTVNVEGEGTHVETSHFYYRPQKNTYSQETGSGGLAAKFKAVVKLSADGTKAELVNGGHYTDRELDFVVRDATPKTFSDGTVAVKVKVLFTRIPKDWKVKTVDSQWVTPDKTSAVDLLVPFKTP
jgi:hypothetical protein